MIYVISFLAVTLTPIPAKLISPLFDWVGYGAMEPFFDEVFTCIIWIVEILVFEGINKKKFKTSILSNAEVKGHELPLKRVFIISGIVAACILIISAQIDFQVKPFYDLGEKFSGYELLNNAGIFLRNIVKCFWIVIMLKAAQEFLEQQFGTGKGRYLYAGLAMVLTVGIYDFVMGMNNLPVTYSLLYLVYGIIYMLAEKHMLKSYLLIMLIYLF